MRFMLILLLFTAQFAAAQEKRSFSEIFPGIPSEVREAAFSAEGYTKAGSNIYDRTSTLDPEIADAVLMKKPGFLIETIQVIPDAEGEYSLLDVYNALGRIRGLKGRVYYSETRRKHIPLFEDVTRIESAAKSTVVDDPAPVSEIPASETVYMKMRDVNFGNSYYRGEVTAMNMGLRYSLTNYRNLTFLFVPVIREEKFIVQLYFEPISEGVLIYALAGVDVSDFILSKVDMPTAIGKRLVIIMDWVTEGITGG